VEDSVAKRQQAWSPFEVWRTRVRMPADRSKSTPL